MDEGNSVLLFWDEGTCQEHYEQVDLKGECVIIKFAQPVTNCMALTQPHSSTDSIKEEKTKCTEVYAKRLQTTSLDPLI